MAKVLLDSKALKAKGVNRHPVTLWRDVREGRFPAPVKIGSRNFWVEAEIDAYIERLMKQRDAQPRKEKKPAPARRA